MCTWESSPNRLPGDPEVGSKQDCGAVGRHGPGADKRPSKGPRGRPGATSRPASHPPQPCPLQKACKARQCGVGSGVSQEHTRGSDWHLNRLPNQHRGAGHVGGHQWGGGLTQAGAPPLPATTSRMLRQLNANCVPPLPRAAWTLRRTQGLPALGGSVLAEGKLAPQISGIVTRFTDEETGTGALGPSRPGL